MSVDFNLLCELKLGGTLPWLLNNFLIATFHRVRIKNGNKLEYGCLKANIYKVGFEYGLTVLIDCCTADAPTRNT